MPTQGWKKDPKPDLDIYQLCEMASERLQQAGFELTYVSMKSEARYFSWPGRKDLLRVAAHSRDNKTLGVGRTVAKLTFPPSSPIPGFLRITETKAESMIAFAVGQYFMRRDAR